MLQVGKKKKDYMEQKKRQASTPGFVIDLNCIGDTIVIISYSPAKAHTRSIKMLNQLSTVRLDCMYMRSFIHPCFLTKL